MKIKAVDDKKDLFIVENILPKSLLNNIEKLPLNDLPWEYQPMQENWPRRKLLPDQIEYLIDFDKVLQNEFLDLVEDQVGIKFVNKIAFSSFWLDLEGFDCAIHEDGAERGYTPYMAMQLYLTESYDSLGTVFYNDSKGKTIRYAFPYRQNTGYLMLNRPGQWHGMLVKVPQEHLRLSSYTYFGQFENK